MRRTTTADLARQTGIPRRTWNDWCQRTPGLAVKRGRNWHVRLDRIPGLDLIEALTLDAQRWIRAVDLARAIGMSRRTIVWQCAHGFLPAVRVGRIWRINLHALAEADDPRWSAVTAKLSSSGGNPRQQKSER